MSILDQYNNDYMPTVEALNIIRTRISEKIALRPGWYRYYGIQK